MQNIDAPLVSIIIPVYNGEKYLAEAIDSALAQTYEKIEIIVVNDGSQDKSDMIAKSYQNKIRYFSKENGGVSSALNLAIKNMKGEYFSWLSHDDLYYPNKIEDQVKYILLQSKKTIIYSNENIINGNGDILKKAKKHKKLQNSLIFELLHNRFIGGCSLLIPRTAFDEVSIFDESLKTIQDYDLWFKMLNSGYNFEYLPIVSGASRIHDNQVSVTQRSLCNEEIQNGYKKIIDSLKLSLLNNTDDDYAKTFNKLAYLYKRNNELLLYRFCLKKSEDYKATLASQFYKTKALLYTKYLTPLNYLRYFKFKFIKLKSLIIKKI